MTRSKYPNTRTAGTIISSGVLMPSKFHVRDIPGLIKCAFQEWAEDDAFGKAAAVAYYAVFSLPGLLLIVVTVAGIALDESTITGTITNELAAIVGQEPASGIRDILMNAKLEDRSTFATIIGVASLIFGSTGLFFQLQKSLNDIWEVEKNEKAGFLRLLKDRATSLGIVIAIGFLLLLSMVLSTAISVLNDWLVRHLGEGVALLTQAGNLVLSMVIITLLFAAIYKVLPDVKIPWRMVWLASIITAVLFTIGKTLIAFYLSKVNPASTFGTSGLVILILIWVSYSCVILFYGAEFTMVFGRRYGFLIEPAPHAQWTAEYRLNEAAPELTEAENPSD